VAVVGGGDTACEEASYLAGLASKVYLIVRKPYLRASKIMQERVFNNEKIEVLFETNTLGLFGENGVEGAHLIYRKGESDEREYDLPIDGFFLAIGHHPNSELFTPWLKTDENGFIMTEGDTPCTNVPGVYVAGDVADSKYRQAVIAAGSGAKAAMEAETPDWPAFDKMLDEKGELIDKLNKLDDGFNAVFERIKQELLENKEMYKPEIEKLKEQIREVTDMSTSLQAAEEKNRDLVTRRINESRRQIKQNRTTARAAGRYYNAMNKLNFIDPQLMDSKK
jgi:hypothetical protein